MSSSNSKLSKAKFVLLKGKNAQKEILLPFNPQAYSVEKTNEFSEKKLLGLKGVVNQFTNSKIGDLSLELLFDSSEEGEDVRQSLKELDLLSSIDGELHAPPPVQFIWGNFIYDGITTGIKKDFTFFYQDGIPARAKVSVSLKPYIDVEKIKKELDLQSSDISKRRVYQEGDSLFLIAHREYNNSADWRLIADKNSIYDPLALESGRELILPPKIKENDK